MLVCILCHHSEEERLSTHRESSQLIELRQRGVAFSFGWVDLDLGHHPTVFMVKNMAVAYECSRPFGSRRHAEAHD